MPTNQQGAYLKRERGEKSNVNHLHSSHWPALINEDLVVGGASCLFILRRIWFQRKTKNKTQKFMITTSWYPGMLPTQLAKTQKGIFKMFRTRLPQSITPKASACIYVMGNGTDSQQRLSKKKKCFATGFGRQPRVASKLPMDFPCRMLNLIFIVSNSCSAINAVESLLD